MNENEMTTQKEIEQIDKKLRERDFFAELESSWRNSLPRSSDIEWLKVFPEAQSILPEKIKELKSEKQRLVDIVKKYLRGRTSTNYWKIWVSLHVAVIPRIEDATKHIARLKRQVQHTSAPPIQGRITEADIQRAREVPIASLIPSNVLQTGKTITAKCPLHNDHSPSFVIYTETNSCWCFGCQQGGDSIALTRLLHSISFIEAVKYLLHV